jgi:hypothetical protein
MRVLMPAKRTVLLVASGLAAAAACALFLANVHTSESALRALDPPGESRPLRASLPQRAPGAEGWRWATGAPGFAFGPEERFWNSVQLSPGRRARIEATARRAHLVSGRTRVLKEVEAAPSHDVIALVAAPAPSGRVCLAFSGRGLPSRFTCMTPGSRAAATSALLALSIWNGPRDGHAAHTLDLVGVARGDVTSIEFAAPGFGSWSLYRRSQEFTWGTFALGIDLPRRWSGRLTLRRGAAKAVTVRLRSELPGRRVLYPEA